MTSDLISVLVDHHPGRIVSVRYTNKRGTVAVHTMILCDYGGVLDRSLARVEGMTDADLAARCPAGIDMATMRIARDEVLASFKASKARFASGEDRKGNYTERLTVDGEAVPGMFSHVSEPDRVYVQGLRIAYREIEPGTPKKPVNSRPKTIAKNAIKRGLSVAKWQALKGAEIVTLAAEGARYEAHAESATL